VLADGAEDAPEALTRERVERLRKAAEQSGPAPSTATKFRAQQAERMRRDRARAAIAAWGATGAALAASAAGMVAFRQDVAEIWPHSASAFAAMGLDVNVYGLEFYDLAVERAFDGPTPMLLVSGEVRNIGRDVRRVPPLRLTLRDDSAKEIYEIVAPIANDELDAGAATPFQIRVENPPESAVDLEATFANFAEAHGLAAVRGDEAEEPLELTEPVATPQLHSQAGAPDGLRGRPETVSSSGYSGVFELADTRG